MIGDYILLIIPAYFLLIGFLHLVRSTRKIAVNDHHYPSVSFIVPAWNEEQTIENAINSLVALEQQYPGSIEIIVVDNRSTDQTAAIITRIASQHRFVRLLRETHHQGKSYAFNKGARAARYPLIACVDADSYPTYRALVDMVRIMRAPEVGAVTGKLVVRNPHTPIEWLQYIEYIWSNIFISAFDAIDSVYIARGPLSLYRKDLFLAIGGFEHPHVTPTEDMEITFRIRKAGFAVRSSRYGNGSTTVMPTLKKLFWQRIRWNRGTFINLYLHRDMVLNPTFRTFGLFTLPFVISSQLMVFFSFFYYLYRSISMTIHHEPYTPLFYGFLIFNLVSYVAFVAAGYTESEERFRVAHTPWIAAGMTAYALVLFYFWISAIAMQMVQKKIIWRTTTPAAVAPALKPTGRSRSPLPRPFRRFHIHLPRRRQRTTVTP